MNNETIIRNGELREIHQRLVKLETVNDERWSSHDKRSTEVWDEIKEKLNILFSKIDGVGTIKESRDYTNKIVAWVLGLTVTILIALYNVVSK